MAALTRFGSALLATILFSLFPAFAEEENTSVTSGTSTEEPVGRFIERKSEGWYWYQDPKEVVPPKQPKPAPKVAKKAEQEKPKDQPFSVEWLRKNIPVLLDKAIDNPTKENVEAFYYAQRVMMDKSQVYSEKARQVVTADPFLDENNRIPFSSYSKSVFMDRVTESTDDAMRHLAKTGGIWLFFDSKCVHCKTQIYTVNMLAEKYGFIVKHISTDGNGLPEAKDFVKDNGMAAKLNLVLTPTTVFVVPPNNYYIVSQGLMARDMLVERLLVAAESNDLLPKELMLASRPYTKGVLQTGDVAAGAGDDPSVWVKRLKESLKGRY